MPCASYENSIDKAGTGICLVSLLLREEKNVRRKHAKKASKQASNKEEEEEEEAWASVVPSWSQKGPDQLVRERERERERERGRDREGEMSERAANEPP